jgi:DNA-binding protein HU-beta
MKKRELAQAIAIHTDVDPKVAAKVLDGALDVILATVAKGEDVALTGFAKFSKVKRPARMARNPATGAQVRVKAKTVAKITPLKGFKDVVLGVTPAPKLQKPSVAAAAVATRAPVQKVAAKKAAPAAGVRKTAAKKAAPVKAAPVQKVAAKKVAAKKVAAKKAAPAAAAKKVAAKKAAPAAAAKKAPVKKVAAKKTAPTKR